MSRASSVSASGIETLGLELIIAGVFGTDSRNQVFAIVVGMVSSVRLGQH